MGMKRLLSLALAGSALVLAALPMSAQAGCRTYWAYDHWERRCWAPPPPRYYGPPPPRFYGPPPPPRWHHHHGWQGRGPGPHHHYHR